eukprot:PITA_20837
MLDTCQRHQIVLNLNKCTFLVPFGNLLSHVVCKKGLMVDPAKVTVILNLQVPCNVKQLHTMLGHTGYYHNFIKGYVQITTLMEQLLKKDATYCWNDECKKSLEILKEKMTLNFMSMLMHRVSRWVLYSHKKEWKELITRSHSQVDDCPTLKITTPLLRVKEYDFEVIVKLGRLNASPNHLSRIENSEETTNLEGLLDAQLYAVRIANGHFEDIIHFLTIGTALQGYSIQHKKELILAEAHAGVAGGHYVGRAIAQKILHVGLWWPTLHQDSKAYFRACDVCQRTGKPSRRDEMPPKPQMMLQPFGKWAIEFMGPITPQGKTGAHYIITAIEYLTQWVEAQPVKHCTTTTAAKFLFENVLTQFG